VGKDNGKKDQNEESELTFTIIKNKIKDSDKNY